MNYYYLDPDRMGLCLFNFYTQGLILWNEELHRDYMNTEEVTYPDPGDSWDPAWFSLLEQGTSDTLSILYTHFQSVPYGRYAAFFTFPGLSYQVDWEDLDQANGRIWLGEIQLSSEVEIDYWY